MIQIIEIKKRISDFFNKKKLKNCVNKFIHP